MADEKDLTTTTYVECTTGYGQTVEIRCRSGNTEQVEEFMKTIHSVHIPETSNITIGHGGYGKYTRFIVKQHKYAGGGYGGCGGFIEVLEIKNPQQGRCGIVINKYSNGRSIFYEFESLNEAVKAWNKSFSFSEELRNEKGFIRQVNCGLLEPWFYAAGNQAINGDFTFPDHLNHNHPVYRTGRKVKLMDCEEREEIKICWGTTTRKYDKGEKESLIIQFDDGTTWDESRDYGKKVLPLNEEDLLKEKVLDAVRGLLDGKMDKVVVFMKGKKLTIESVKTDKPISCHFTNGVQKMIDGGEIREAAFVIRSWDKIMIGNKSLLAKEDL